MNDKPQHLPTCPTYIAVHGAVAVECEHGYDVCPKCDACTCQKETPSRS